MIETTRALIRMPTVSRDSNRQLIDYVAGLLEQKGYRARLQYSPDGAKANMVVTIGPPDVAGVVLAGHSDVVPVENQQWSHPPFDPVVRDARLYGRGACDMKGFVGVVLARLLALDPATLARPLHLVLTYDEEVGCGGAKALMQDVAALLPVAPLYCVVGEPTNMEVLAAHKGMRIFHTTVTGVPGHSSIPVGTASAVAIAARLIDCLAGMGEEMATRPAHGVPAFTYPFTTVNVGTVQGGDAVNIVAPYAHFTWEYRYPPGQDRNEILRRFEVRAAELLAPYQAAGMSAVTVNTDEISEIPPLGHACGHDQALDPLLARHYHGRGADYCAEAGLYQQGLGCPVVLCGPGSITQAHKQDEYVTLAQLEQCDRFIGDIIRACQLAEAAEPAATILCAE
ncbi:acetylornithine deacetylase [Pseudoduganella armeniaca]|nr:acetylornithine deacetylase [Pseudoduganella armeniaca]